MAKKQKVTIAWMLIVILEGMIFYFSSKTASASSESSSSVIAFLHHYFPIIVDNHFFQLLVRKGAHISEFALLTIFSRIAFSLKKHPDLMTFCFVLLSASFDEFHQLFVEGRAGMIVDVGIDLCGCLFILVVGFLLRQNK